MADKKQIKAIIQQYADKGKRLYAESYNEKKEKYAIGFWDGYKSCADGLLRELENIQEEPKFKLGDIVRRKSDGLQARVINIVNGTYIVECEDWNDLILESQWELVEEQEPRYPSFEESQGECHLFQDIALNG